VTGRGPSGTPGRAAHTPPLGLVETTPAPAPRMRKDDRTALELPVVVSDAANRVQGGIRFESADVSTGGAFLRTDLLFEVGELLTLQFQLPGAGRVIRAEGRVVRVSRELSKDHAPGMGVEFVDLSADDRAAIEARLRP
jgi:uncharacterized protein (TIGR02266 family)